MGEGNEIHVDGEEHELDCHEKNDDILPIEKDAHDTDGKEDRSEYQEM
jgi:hypothetical protein